MRKRMTNTKCVRGLNRCTTEVINSVTLFKIRTSLYILKIIYFSAPLVFISILFSPRNNSILAAEVLFHISFDLQKTPRITSNEDFGAN